MALNSKGEVDYELAINTLEKRVQSVFSRLQAGKLEAGDFVDERDVEFPDFSDLVARLHGSEKEFDEIFSTFRRAYSPFSMFTEEETVLDIGADWGYSVLAMRANGCSSSIFSVDVTPFHRAALDRLVEVEKGRYKWANQAVGSRSGPLEFFSPILGGQAISGLTSTGGTLNGTTIPIVLSFAESYCKDGLSSDKPLYQFGLLRFTVEGASLDKILKNKGIDPERVSAIKMDIEGHEGPALNGARDLIEKRKPLIMVEGANRSGEVCRTLSGFGYFHCELHDGAMEPHLGKSDAQDGYWVHPSHVDRYRSHGCLRGELPDQSAINQQGNL